MAAAVVVMGDFNDEPFDRSLMDYANSSNSEQVLTGAAGIKICKESAEVVYCPSMMNKNGTPRRFGRPTSGMDLTGASDHLPVGACFQAKTKR